MGVSREALDHPAVDEHVEYDHRECGDDRGGHELAPVEYIAVNEQVKTDRNNDRHLVLDEHEGVKELVPREREGEDC